MNILFCGDSNVCKGIYLATLSLCKNVFEELNIYILTANVTNHTAIPQNFKTELQKAVESYNPQHKVYLFDISYEFENYLPSANMGTRFTPLCMLRLFADKIDAIPERILYLDADVLCRADFSEFYYTNIETVEIVGVPDRYGKWFFGNILKHDYFNSGVLLLNMKNIRQSGLFEKCRELCQNKKMFMPDQTALNKFAVKKKVESKYNCQGKIKNNTVFKHFTTFFKFLPYLRSVTVKPWEEEKMHNILKIYEFDEIINEYKRRTTNESTNPDFLYN